MRDTKNEKAFTLVELLVALMVTSIILSAVATLAYTLGKVNSSSGDSARIQAQVRFATLRLSDLIRHSKLVCKTSGDDLAIWRADDGNNKINIEELTYISAGAGRDHIRLYECSNVSEVGLSEIDSVGTSWWLGYYDSDAYVAMIPQCSNVEFSTEPNDIAVPYRRLVTISFDVIENESTRHYQISAALRGWAGHLLNEDGTAIVGDDD